MLIRLIYILCLVKESNDLQSQVKTIPAHQENPLHYEKIAMIKRPLPPPPCNNDPCLPDMLTNTPEAIIRNNPAMFYDARKQLNQITDNTVKAKDNLAQKSEMPVQSAKGFAVGHATKTSCSENHAESSAPPAILSSVRGGQPNSEQHKLRITAPFSINRKIHVSDKNDSGYLNNSTTTSQYVQSDPKKSRESLGSRSRNDVKSSKIIEHNIQKGSQVSKPGFLHNKTNLTQTTMNGDTSVSKNSNGIDGSRNSVQRSSLKRSDSYRRARTILSPDLSRNNRKSLEIAATNNNSMVISKTLTNKSPCEKAQTNNSPILASSNEPTKNGKAQHEKGKEANKNNFFKNLRSQFSFSSLRVKKNPKKAMTISPPLELQQTSDLNRRNSFSSTSVSNKLPQQPQMTSTPVSESSTKSTKNSEIKSEKQSVKSSSEWPESPKTSSNPGVRFRTAALKKQHQRWSYAEQHYAGFNQCLSQQPHPTTTPLNFIHPNQYVLEGHGHNIYQHIHHHPYHLPLVSYVPICGNCCPNAPNPVFVGTQRSSITSLRGLTHGKKIATIF